MVKSVYIHIPFCKNICHYCDFSKVIYQSNWVTDYLKSLKDEIKREYQNSVISTLYIGGGTPNSLSYKEMKQLLDITKIFSLEQQYEFTIECNIEDLTLDKIKLMKQYGVNRISLGVQTTQNKYLKLCNRNHTYSMVKEVIQIIKQEGIDNINVDFMYGFPNQTLKEVKEDIERILKLDVTHISTYSLMIEPHTVFYQKNISNIDQDLDFNMYQIIMQKLKDNHYEHYEISNYAKDGYVSKHNLTYWNNEKYYGFGLSASSYIGDKRKTNTKNLKKYLENNNCIWEIEEITPKLKLEYEFILGFRKIKGIEKKVFYQKYHFPIEEHKIVKKLLREEKLKQNAEYIYIDEKHLYISNEILLHFIS